LYENKDELRDQLSEKDFPSPNPTYFSSLDSTLFLVPNKTNRTRYVSKEEDESYKESACSKLSCMVLIASINRLTKLIISQSTVHNPSTIPKLKTHYFVL
jgi:hypothetical protein